jgi:sec-independent protein translocase protein TatA
MADAAGRRRTGVIEMGGLSVWHWLIFLAVALLLFGGKGKISSIMGDVADGIKSFKKGMAEEPPKPVEPPKTIEATKPADSVSSPGQPTKTG